MIITRYFFDFISLHYPTTFYQAFSWDPNLSGSGQDSAA